MRSPSLKWLKYKFPKFGRGIYFSFITLTTLGYGDYRPVGKWRYLAAFEAILGYIFLGVFIYVLTSTSESHPYGPENWMRKYEEKHFILHDEKNDKLWENELNELLVSIIKQIEDNRFNIEAVKPLCHSAWWELWSSPGSLFEKIYYSEMKQKKSKKPLRLRLVRNHRKHFDILRLL